MTEGNKSDELEALVIFGHDHRTNKNTSFEEMSLKGKSILFVKQTLLPKHFKKLKSSSKVVFLRRLWIKIDTTKPIHFSVSFNLL